MTNPPDQIEINKSLMEAASNGNSSGVRKALQSGANVNFAEDYAFGSKRNTWYSTALGVSAFYGHLQVVQYLVDAGANPYLSYKYFNRKTPIELAREREHEVVEKYLDVIMKHPKWMDKIDETTGYTPLTYSILSIDHTDTGLQKVQTLIESGADVCRMDKRRKTPLIYAIKKNKLEVVKLLLDKGAIATAVTALTHAFNLRSNDILKCMFEYKQSLIDEIFLNDGSTPLTKAISTCNLEIAKYLIENGADAEKTDLNGNTPLEKALLDVPGVEIAELLVSKGAKVPNTLKQSLFQKIAEYGNIGIYDFLIKNQWDVNQVDEAGKSALALSASNENLLLSRLLIEKGAKLELAVTEVEACRKKNPDFNWFIKSMIPKKQRCLETGQE